MGFCITCSNLKIGMKYKVLQLISKLSGFMKISCIFIFVQHPKIYQVNLTTNFLIFVSVHSDIKFSRRLRKLGKEDVIYVNIS